MGSMSAIKSKSLYNTPFELGLRMVYLLFALRPHEADLLKLVMLDYAIVYSKDVGGPESLHTPVPYRNSELFSRRERIEQGLYLMSSRGLIDIRVTANGLNYIAGSSSFTMVGSLSSKYWRELTHRCRWAAQRFGEMSTRDMQTLFANQGHLWGAELELAWSPI